MTTQVSQSPGAAGVPDAAAPARPASTRSLALRGSAAVVVTFGAGTVLRLGTSLILTRLLAPDIFGLLLLVSVLMQGLAMFSDIGIGPSVVRHPRGNDRRFLDTAWTMQAARGGVLMVAAWLLAWPYARLYGHPELVALCMVVALNSLLGGLTSIKVHTQTRELAVHRVMYLDLGCHFAGAITTVVLAVMALRAGIGGVWAVVAGGLVQTGLKAALSYAVLPGPRAGFGLEREALRDIMAFGGWVFLSTVLTFLAGQADRMMLGGLVSADELGVYAIALTVASIITNMVLRVGSGVVFPAYSKAVVAGRPLREVFHRARLPLVVGSGLMLGPLIATGPQLIQIMYDPRWAGAGWMLQVLAVGAWFEVLQCTGGSALWALGASKPVSIAHAVRLVVLLAGIPAGFYLWGGMEGALWAVPAAEGLRYLVVSALIRRHGLRVVRGDLVLSGTLALSVGAGLLAVWAVGPAVPATWWGTVATLMSGCAAAGFAWLPWVIPTYRSVRSGGGLGGHA